MTRQDFIEAVSGKSLQAHERELMELLETGTRLTAIQPPRNLMRESMKDLAVQRAADEYLKSILAMGEPDRNN